MSNLVEIAIKKSENCHSIQIVKEHVLTKNLILIR